MLSKISDIVEKQRCSVLSLSSMDGTLYSGQIQQLCLKQKMSSEMLLRKPDICKKGSVNASQPFQSTKPLLRKPIKGYLHTIEPL